MSDNNFFYFSDATKGESGKPVYIDFGLFPQFLYKVDPGTFDGIEIIKGIEGLRSSSVDVNSSSNSKDSFLHKKEIGAVEIHYKVYQCQDDGGLPGVYVTNIKSNYKGDGKDPGLYRARELSGFDANLDIKKQDSGVVDTVGACIGGMASLELTAKNAKKALERYGISGDGWKTDFGLFYIPVHIRNELGNWINPVSRQHDPLIAAKELALVIKSTQKARSIENLEPLDWLVVGEAAEILNKAVELLEKDPEAKILDKHRFRFLNPSIPRKGIFPNMLGVLKQKCAELTTDAVILNDNYPATVNLSLSLQETVDALGSRFHKKNIDMLTKGLAGASKGLGEARTKFASDTRPTFMSVVDEIARKVKTW
ncbi:hypothetical protein O5O45_16350 [Hahella aquimaris]|uniref:hypothetical protein n=1 Tax=Hahella sp. HNIBRBA332 TaxID=3015983 RepID=UPI00273B9267|nr:hypothetical protein [Hahella sp. HNIBRBA332]WLQ11318.1 hypothetical protein O5O45_16350 [Hahella sp. HNIBRBA332]